MKLPTIQSEESDHAVKSTDSIWSHKALIFGTIAIFFYVGAEVSIGSFLVNYLSQPEIGGLNERQASQMVSYYWGAAMIGRFVGAALTRVIAPIYVLAFNSAYHIHISDSRTRPSYWPWLRLVMSSHSRRRDFTSYPRLCSGYHKRAIKLYCACDGVRLYRMVCIGRFETEKQPRHCP